MADWEAFLARVPAQEHKAWSQRAQGKVVDGSPKWEVFRAVELPAGGGAASPAAPAAAAAPRAGAPPAGSAPAAGGGRLVFADKIAPEDVALWEQQAARGLGGGSSSSAGSSSGDGGGGGVSGSGSDSDAGSDAATAAADGEVVLDWKGDPMVIKPGDKLPFKFL
jgi:hypothetical protein